MVGVVADEVRVEVVKEGKRAEVEGDAQNRHVVGVHHTVTKAVSLPFGDQFGVAFDDLAEHGQIRFWLFKALGEVQGQDVLGQLLLLLGLFGVVKVFEMPKADMARRQAQYHGGTLLFFAPYRGVGADNAQCPAAGNAQCMQRLRGKKLANG